MATPATATPYQTGYSDALYDADKGRFWNLPEFAARREEYQDGYRAALRDLFRAGKLANPPAYPLPVRTPPPPQSGGVA